MITKAYALLPKLKYLVLAGQNDKKELEFIGTSEQWARVWAEINEHERIHNRLVGEEDNSGR